MTDLEVWVSWLLICRPPGGAAPLWCWPGGR